MSQRLQKQLLGFTNKPISKATGMSLLCPVRNAPFCDSKLYYQLCNLMCAGQNSLESELELP